LRTKKEQFSSRDNYVWKCFCILDSSYSSTVFHFFFFFETSNQRLGSKIVKEMPSSLIIITSIPLFSIGSNHCDRKRRQKINCPSLLAIGILKIHMNLEAAYFWSVLQHAQNAGYNQDRQWQFYLLEYNITGSPTSVLDNYEAAQASGESSINFQFKKW